MTGKAHRDEVGGGLWLCIVDGYQWCSGLTR